MEFKKTLLIIMLVFSTTYGWLNFDLIPHQLGALLDPVIREDIQQNTTEYTGQIYSYPISSKKVDKKPILKNESKPVEIKPNLALIPITSNYELSIPSLKITAPIIFEPTVIESRIYSALEKGVVHYTESPKPGDLGTAVILGHSSSYPWYKGSYGSIFSNLSKLNKGDVIIINNKGDTLNYKVSQSLIFSPETSDDYALRELEYTDGSSIVLMTCWPTGTNAKRVAVRADLVL